MPEAEETPSGLEPEINRPLRRTNEEELDSAEVRTELAAGLSDAGEKFTPTQVQLVELLQFVKWAKHRLNQFRLGVVISAWDVIMKGRPTTPDQWLEDRLPMLHQFLAANHESFCSRVYGVSAQGGDIKQEADTLRAKLSPSERIIVVEGTTQSADITIPIRYVMGIT
jgi:hypothetical protein